MSHRILSTLWVSVFVVAQLLAVDGLHATETSVRCGDIVRGEFTKPQEILDYVLYMEAGQIIRIQAIPIGDFLNFRTQVLEPAGNLIYDSGEWDKDLEHDPNVRTGTLSANGTYRIRLWNYGWTSTGNAGVFSLHIGCILADGTEINPGASAPAAPPPPSTPAPSPPLTAPEPAGQTARVESDWPSSPAPAPSLWPVVNEYEALLPALAVALEADDTDTALMAVMTSLLPLLEETFAPDPSAYAEYFDEYAQHLDPVGVDTRPMVGIRNPAAPSPAPTVVTMQPASTQAPNSFQGLPVLTPSELAGLAFEKIALGRKLAGEISAQGRQVAGLRFDAEQGTEVDLAFLRRSGNLNLGLILLDPLQQVAFQAALVVNSGVTTRLKMPMRGEYTVAIATIEPLSSSPVKTGFSIALIEVGAAAAGSRAGH